MTTDIETTENPNEAAAQPSQCYDLLNALQVIDSYSCHIFDNVDSFLERFFDGQLVMGLVDVYFAPSELKVYYVLDCGQHITTTVSIVDYLSWLESI